MGYNIARCIKLAQATLQHPGNPGCPTQNCSEIHDHFLAGACDIFSGIDRVYRGIIKCIKLAETTLQCSNPKEPEESTRAFNRNLDDFINKLGEISPLDLVGKVEQSFGSDPASTHAVLELPKLTPTWSEATPAESLSILEEDLD